MAADKMCDSLQKCKTESAKIVKMWVRISNIKSHLVNSISSHFYSTSAQIFVYNKTDAGLQKFILSKDHH